MWRVAFIGIASRAIQTPATGLMFLRRETLQMKFNTNNKTKTKTKMETTNIPIGIIVMLGVILSIFIKW
jgi:hypothetical protein